MPADRHSTRRLTRLPAASTINGQERAPFFGNTGMGKTLDLGTRIELFSMDRHCHDISLALYRRQTAAGPVFLVHTYSSAPDARQRVDFIHRALTVMTGLELAGAAPPWLRFACGTGHEKALRRAFLDLCKLESCAPLAAKPLRVFDKKADCHLEAESQGGGVYRLVAEQPTETARKRAIALAGGFAKLCQMEHVEGADVVAFGCRMSHDALIGQLMYRAQNVRAVFQEDEMAASRGMLAAPSQQK